MEFCPECGNILLPKKRTKELFCRVCQKGFTLDEKIDKDKFEQYKKVKKNKSKVDEKRRALKTAIIEKSEKSKSMTEDEREAFGELLEMSGD